MISRAFRYPFSLGMSLLLASCAGANLRPDFQASEPVFQREWSVSTRIRENLAGERGVEFSNPLIWENTLLFGTSEAGLVAIYPSLGGQTRWVLPVRDGIASEMTLQGNLLYFGGADGFLYCVNPENGRVVWRYEVKSPRISKPTVFGGKVLVTTSDDVVFALDAATGRWIWHYHRTSAGAASIHGASQPWTDGNRVLVGMSDGYLVSLGIADGKLEAEKKLTTRTKFTDIDAGVVPDGSSVIYVPSYDGELYALKRDTLETLWRYDSGGTRSVSIDGETLYLASSDGKIHALKKSSGKLLWKFEMDGGTPTPMVMTEKNIIVGSSYQFLYAIKKTDGTLQDRWNVGYGSGFAGSMAYDASKRTLYAVSGAANLYSFKVR